MTSGGTSRHASGSSTDTAIAALAVGAAAVLFGVFAGAWLATRFTGGSVDGDVGGWLVALIGLVRSPGDPAGAWSGHARGFPGPVVYWVSTAVSMLVIGVAGVVVVRWWRRTSTGGRVRFGVSTDARMAGRGDVGRLRVSSSLPPSGRFLLGRMVTSGSLLATESGTPDRRGRRGSRGSLALIGPTQSGKTTLLSAGMIGWDGPVVALSVKRDLFDVTARARAEKGAVAVFDPGGCTGLPSARWTPLRGVKTASGALRAGRALASALPRNGVTGGDYWAQQGESFVSAYMAVAGLSQLLPPESDGSPRAPLTMQRLTAWVFHGVGIKDPTVNELVRSGLASDNKEIQFLAEAAALKLNALEKEDPRIRASIYATARLAFEAWGEPSVAHSASEAARDFYNTDAIGKREPRFLDLDWLMGKPGDGKANTLYLVAPDAEFKRLAPVLGGLLGDLREQIHSWDVEGRRLHKPLLVVIDEAAQLELRWLPEEVSTIAGLGGMFVTCWQSKAQIDHAYRTLADAVLGGHRSKIVFAGCDDPATLNWVGKVAGSEQVPHRGWSADTFGGRRTISEHTQREELAAAHVVRQMKPGEGILLHGTLPPVHVRSVPWWKDRTLAARVPRDDDGRPTLPESLSTCPVSADEAKVGDAALDRSAREEAQTHLPEAEPTAHRKSPAASSASSAQRSKSGTATAAAQPSLFDAEQPRNRVSSRCRTCSRVVKVGEGVEIATDPRLVIACDRCAEDPSRPSASHPS